MFSVASCEYGCVCRLGPVLPFGMTPLRRHLFFGWLKEVQVSFLFTGRPRLIDVIATLSRERSVSVTSSPVSPFLQSELLFALHNPINISIVSLLLIALHKISSSLISSFPDPLSPLRTTAKCPTLFRLVLPPGAQPRVQEVSYPYQPQCSSLTNHSKCPTPSVSLAKKVS